MKRITALTLIFLIAIFSCLNVSATETDGSVYVIGNVTIIFDETSTLTADEQQYIAEYLVYGGNDIETYGLWCNLFGHKYVEEIVTTITHCVSATSPRCLRETYEVRTCERCGNVEMTLVSSMPITCCP